MGIVGPNSVYLDVKALGREEFLVNKASILADAVAIRIEIARDILLFSEESLAAASIRLWIIDIDIVVFSVYGLFNKGLIDLLVTNN